MLQRNPEVRLDPDVEFLLGVREAIERRGWTYGCLSAGPGGPVCLIGAGMVALKGRIRHDMGLSDQIDERLCELLEIREERYVDGHGDSLHFHTAAWWNDYCLHETHEQSKARVLARVDQAIDRLSKRAAG